MKKNLYVTKVASTRSIVFDEGTPAIVDDNGMHAVLFGRGEDEMKKAKLFAAAPELLEAAIDLLDEIEFQKKSGGSTMEALKRATSGIELPRIIESFKAAIAKAEGRE